MTRAADALDALTAEAQRNGEYDATPLVLVVPMPASHNRSGKSRNPFTIAREKKAYGLCLDTMALCCARRCLSPDLPWVVPSAPDTPIHRALITVTEVVVGATNDADNLAFRVQKWVGDWLVTRRYIATDMEHRKRDGAGCRWAALPTQHVTRSETPRIALTIQPDES